MGVSNSPEDLNKLSNFSIRSSDQLLADIRDGLSAELAQISDKYHLNMASSRSNALGNKGAHIVLSGDENAPANDPDVGMLSAFLGAFQNLIDAKNLGALRVELNSEGLRNRKHFHMHIMRTDNIDFLTSKAPELGWQGQKYEYSTKFSEEMPTEFINKTLSEIKKNNSEIEGFRTIMTISAEGISVFVVKKADLPESVDKPGERFRSVDKWPL